MHQHTFVAQSTPPRLLTQQSMKCVACHQCNILSHGCPCSFELQRSMVVRKSCVRWYQLGRPFSESAKQLHADMVSPICVR